VRRGLLVGAAAWLAITSLAITSLAIASPTDSQNIATVRQADSALDAQVRAISAVLRCPVCQGESIQDSPAELAQQMRAIVRVQLEEGRSPDEIKEYFVARYGEWILLEPKMTGLNILLYLFPVVLVAGGLAFVFVIVRRWTSTRIAAPDGTPPAGP
jgi:cytochrome c-type biogenesis protein CcmH